MPARSGFNEAAGIPRGRRGAAFKRYEPLAYGFNEAAGIPRGRPRGAFRNWLSFNEAAGIPRGRRLRRTTAIGDSGPLQ